VPVDPQALDPHVATDATVAWDYVNIYDTLVDLDASVKLQPSLATSWKQVDPTTWRFTLRSGVKFTDGTPFDADAVVFNVERALNPKDPGRVVSSGGPIAGAKKVDAQTVDILTKGPDPSTLYGLSLKVVYGMCSPTAVQKYGKDYGQHPVGTGPFMLESWQANSQVTLVRNPGYWGNAPTLDKLVFKVIPDAGDRLLAFQNKEIDVLLEPTPSQMLTLTKLPGVQIAKTPGIGISYLAYNLKYPPFDDVRVRLALQHAIDRKTICSTVLGGLAVPATGFMNSNVFGYKNEDLETVYDYNPDKAKALLQQAGWTPGSGGVLTKNGQPFTFPLVVSPGRVPGDKDATVACQQQLAQVGVNAQIVQMEWAPFLTFLKTQPTKYGMFFLTWFAVDADGDFGLTPFDATQMPPVGINRMYYDDPAFQKAFEAGNVELDVNKRQADYAAAQDALVRNPPWIPLFQLYQISALQPYVRGYRITPIEYYVTEVPGVTLAAH
jgi:peptide/nickel transport system substrate-binding protein